MKLEYKKRKYGKVSLMVIDNESIEVSIYIDGNPSCVLFPTIVW